MPSDLFRDVYDSMEVFEVFECHKAKLIAEARAALAEDPGFDPIGLIVDGDAPAAAVLAAESEEPKDWVLALMDDEPGKLLVAALSAHGAKIAAYPLDDDDRRGLASR